MQVETGVVDLTRELAHPRAAVFAAWAEEAAQRSWGHPGEGWHMKFERFAFRVGESDLCRFGPEGGTDYLNENRYLAIDDGRRVAYATSLRTADELTFAGSVAVILEDASGGTRLRLVEHGLYFDGHDSVDGHIAGWTSMLDALSAYLDRSTR